MSNLYEALASLFDSLNALSFRIPTNSDLGPWIARINFKIGSIQTDISGGNDPSGAIARAHQLAGRASAVDPRDYHRVEGLLGTIDAFLDDL